ncbi:ABC-type phosphate/phosphonate transport system, periplasmic component [Xylaria palmicola]|nr:ABC-type phosphate/phosphonate transport system, periplasmic component [Xylaria palmicola]
MSGFIAALPMYDWPERRAEVDAQWASLRDRLRAAGVDAPDRLVRRNRDMPSVPGGIRDAQGNILDLPTLWRHPSLLFSQICYGPMELGLARHVEVVGQQDYAGVEGGGADSYSSALVARPGRDHRHVPAPSGGRPSLPVEDLRGKRLAYNSEDSMSGIMGLQRDLASLNEHLTLFSEYLESGGHRDSIVAVAEGRADVAAIDCLTWQLAKRFEPAANALGVVGWTSRRRGLPFIASRHIPPRIIQLVAHELKSYEPCHQIQENA